MKNEALWDTYDKYTTELTRFARQIAFAGVAVCWFFRTPEITFPRAILVALLLLIAFFFLDLLQYLAGALIHRFWTRRAEKERWDESEAIEGDYDKPAGLDTVPFGLFLGKIAALLGSFLALGSEFLRRL